MSGVIEEGMFYIFLFMPLKIFDCDLELQCKFVIRWFFLFDIILEFFDLNFFYCEVFWLAFSSKLYIIDHI